MLEILEGEYEPSSSLTAESFQDNLSRLGELLKGFGKLLVCQFGLWLRALLVWRSLRRLLMRWPRSRTRCREGIGSSLCTSISLLAVNGVAIPTGAYMLSTLESNGRKGRKRLAKKNGIHTLSMCTSNQRRNLSIHSILHLHLFLLISIFLALTSQIRTLSLTLLVGGGLRIYRAAQGENTQYGRTHFDFTKICTTK